MNLTNKIMRKALPCRREERLIAIGNASNGFLHIPDKGPKSEHRTVFVKSIQFFQKSIHLTVFHNGKDGRGKSRPRMRSIVRLTMQASTPLNIAERSESATV